MNNKENVKRFSMKKLLITVLYTVIVSVFIGSTILFVSSIPGWMQAEILPNLNKDSEILIYIGKGQQESLNQLKESLEEDKAIYGEDYPAEGIFLYNLINVVSTNRIMQVYSMSVLIGIALGTIIYIVVVQNIKGIEMIIELFIAFVILFILIMLLNLGYQAIINKFIGDVNPTDVTYYTYIYDLESNNILIPYIITIAVIYIVNMIRQKILANKLNKQLNNK